MIITAQVAPPNSVVFLISSPEPQVDTEIDGVLTATSTCVVVGTRSELDGPTQITLADEDVPLDGLRELGRATMDTVLHRVVVQTVEGDDVAGIAIPGTSADVVVYGSDDVEPDRVVIRLS